MKTRPAGRVGWIEEEAAVRHQASTRRRVVQLGGHFDMGHQIGPPLGRLGNAGRLEPNHLAPADKAVAVAQPDVAVLWRQEGQQRTRILDGLRPHMEPQRVRCRPGHGAQRNCGSGGHRSARRGAIHFVTAFTISTMLLAAENRGFRPKDRLR